MNNETKTGGFAITVPMIQRSLPESARRALDHPQMEHLARRLTAHFPTLHEDWLVRWGFPRTTTGLSLEWRTVRGRDGYTVWAWGFLDNGYPVRTDVGFFLSKEEAEDYRLKQWLRPGFRLAVHRNQQRRQTRPLVLDGTLRRVTQTFLPRRA